MAYGIKAVKPGENITTTDSLDWNLNTTYPLLKIFGVYTGTIGGADHPFEDMDIVTISHNLGYKPMTLFFPTRIFTSDYYKFNGLAGGTVAMMEIEDNAIKLYGWATESSYLLIIFYNLAE